jgi:DNA-binding HxlR family transcriptional regulator
VSYEITMYEHPPIIIPFERVCPADVDTLKKHVDHHLQSADVADISINALSGVQLVTPRDHLYLLIHLFMGLYEDEYIVVHRDWHKGNVFLVARRESLAYKHNRCLWQPTMYCRGKTCGGCDMIHNVRDSRSDSDSGVIIALTGHKGLTFNELVNHTKCSDCTIRKSLRKLSLEGRIRSEKYYSIRLRRGSCYKYYLVDTPTITV